MYTDYQKLEARAAVRRRWVKGITYAFLGIWALIVLFPFYWMILSSVKSYGQYSSEFVPKFFTLSPTIENYLTAFTAVPLAKYLLNTTIFTVVATAIMLGVTVLAAFGFSRMSFRGRDVAFTIFLSMMMIPNELVIITNFLTVTQLDWRNTFEGLILPSVTSVFYIYLLKENFAQVPDELYWAAKVDGTSDLKYLFKVMVPICRPTLVTITVLKAIECWNSFVWPRLITDDPEYFLVSNAIQTIRESGFGRENIPAMMAAVVVISLPLILLFLVFRKQIMSGVARGGTKGGKNGFLHCCLRWQCCCWYSPAVMARCNETNLLYRKNSTPRRNTNWSFGPKMRATSTKKRSTSRRLRILRRCIPMFPSPCVFTPTMAGYTMTC